MTRAPGLSLRKVSLWRRLWRPFWTLPAAIMIGSLILGIVIPELDRSVLPDATGVFSGQPDGARSLLGTVSSAMISVTGLVFSVTMVVLQLASSQFSPRVLGSFLDARVAQVTLGVFTGSFLYSLTVLRVVRDESANGPAFVPHTAVTVSYVYVVASTAMFLAFIAHITSKVQISRVISDLGHATLQGLREQRPSDDQDPPDADGAMPARSGDGIELVLDERHGHVVAIDADQLLERAVELDLLVRLEVGIGDFLVPGQLLGRVSGSGAGDLEDEDLVSLARCLDLERERVLPLDPLFGTRQLVDIAERALSPGINDPTTAKQVVNELHLVLRVLSTQPDPSPVLLDDDGRARLTYRAQTLARHLEVAVDELRDHAADERTVHERVVRMLDELIDHALPEHRRALARARGMLDA